MEEVVIIGAGPAGLMLACELRLAGVRTIVLEKRAEPGDLPKANGLGGQIIRLLDHRGLLERFSAGSPFAGRAPRFPFGSVPLNFAELGGDAPLELLMIQQPRLERLLGERAAELGAEVRWGHRLRTLVQDDEGVTLEGDGFRLRARYVVGCDGGRSLVREQAGIGFPGTTDDEVLLLGHFKAPHASLFDSPQVSGLQPGWNRTPNGRLLLTSLRPGVHIVGVREKIADAGEKIVGLREEVVGVRDEAVGVGEEVAGVREKGTAPASAVTLEEFEEAVRRVIGVDLPLGEPIWLSSTVSQARLADRYREGRVFLAGDAAHLFPAGGSALNVGLMDTANLAWKLAAHLHGHVPTGLLDTYEAERRPVAAHTLRHTRAQAALERLTGEDGTALRDLLAELLTFEQPLRHLGEMLQGSDIRYGTAPHPLTGRFAPDLTLTTADGPTRVADLMRSADWLLLDLRPTSSEPGELVSQRPVASDLGELVGQRPVAASDLGELVGQPVASDLGELVGRRPVPLDLGDLGDLVRDGRLRVVVAHCAAPPADALLIRPDGYVAWAGTDGLPEAVTTWLTP
ncbi:FAD-dependent monooxygenase [Nonomuraea guangzhouensis]|uniref:FAD-dependent monooxygenase n=1 Tax=Nonomuraea guangzhouensis TaxID=1291555 RepID=A0ABW4GHP1_9ACTN|nr:FAD-dependent monooxygenase [Nonomuraea guangzhouensis]